MKALSIAIALLTGLLIVSTLICGLWIHSRPEPVDPSSITFHIKIAVASIVGTFAVIVLFLVQLNKHGF